MTLKKIFIYLAVILISAWPFFLIFFAVAWTVKSVKEKKQYLNLRLLITSVLTVIALAEIIFRVIGNDQVYMESNQTPIHHILFINYHSPFSPREDGWLHIHYPGFHKREEVNEYVNEAWQTNNEGLHDKKWLVAKTDKCRVIVIGDSFTEGAGASQDSTCARLLAHLNSTLEVMNAGVSASDPAFELRLLEMRLFKYQPDVVIMSINSSDITDFMMRGGLERFRPDSTLQFKPAPWWDPLYGNSFIVRSIVHRYCKLDYHFMSAEEEQRAHTLALRQLTQVISLASKECHDHHIRFIANFHPMCQEVLDDSMECAPVMKELQKQGVETFNMLDYFISHGIDSAHASQYYWPIDRHHNNKGYAIMANGLATLFH